ncbi:LysM peptidoglycan-binding domain-containing protein [Pedobacter insulae]|uniref:LysM repeat-containing protein n=1 Tax=Pedobacter insulae TaxID=414048 RepID=A0A1I3A9N7_9SPHI|nr:LysM peptidoglycan-binding domain-containing protein [Pedobacter insulae]SFH46748.1 LysM repeat-containing protein [Pedobacter insulae]
MQKLYTLLLAALLANTSVSLASNTIDSIGVENNKGKKVIIYKVEPKETYYSIAKKYNVPYKEVMEFNDSQFLQIGVILKIPTGLPFVANSSTTAASSSAGFIEYTIKAKDNLNMLANRYGTTVEEIKNLNQLSSINLQIGQVLKIPTGNEQSAPVETPAAPIVKQAEKAIVATIEPADNTPSGTIISHTIKAKENLNALAQKYGTTVDAIKKLNNLSSINLRIGQVLKIPATNGETDAAVSTVNDGSFEHTVLANETIYSVAKKYNLTTYQITTANNLTSNELTVGQKLRIKGANNQVTMAEEEDDASSQTMRDPALRQAPSKYGLVRFDEKGTAVWIEEPDLDPSKMLVLHRTAPVGTIIRVTNPTTNRSAFAKVVGKFTENETTKDVIIVMTKAVADAVGALDKRFFCNLNYGAVDNEQQ